MASKTGCKIRTFCNVNQLFERLNFRAGFSAESGLLQRGCLCSGRGEDSQAGYEMLCQGIHMFMAEDKRMKGKRTMFPE